MAAAPVPIVMIPGNHDRYAPPSMLPRSDAFDRTFNHFWSAGSSAQTLGVFHKDNAYCAIVGLDLSLRAGSDAGRTLGAVWGRGKAYPDVLSRATVLTADLRARFPDIVVLWAVHFPPHFPGIDPALSLADADVLIDAASQSGVKLLLTGHTHERQLYEATSSSGRSVRVACAGSASQFGESEHTIGILAIVVEPGVIAGGLAMREHMRWYAERAEWISASAIETVPV